MACRYVKCRGCSNRRPPGTIPFIRLVCVEQNSLAKPRHLPMLLASPNGRHWRTIKLDQLTSLQGRVLNRAISPGKTASSVLATTPDSSSGTIGRTTECTTWRGRGGPAQAGEGNPAGSRQTISGNCRASHDGATARHHQRSRLRLCGHFPDIVDKDQAAHMRYVFKNGRTARSMSDGSWVPPINLRLTTPTAHTSTC